MEKNDCLKLLTNEKNITSTRIFIYIYLNTQIPKRKEITLHYLFRITNRIPILKFKCKFIFIKKNSQKSNIHTTQQLFYLDIFHFLS